jgi:hypothetical protein
VLPESFDGRRAELHHATGRVRLPGPGEDAVESSDSLSEPTREIHDRESDKLIDAAITAGIDQSWKKTALIVARVLKSIGEQLSDDIEKDILDRIAYLQEEGAPEIAGDISLPGNSEIRSGRGDVES